MFDIGWLELLLIAGIALIVIGPQEMPTLMHQLGRWIAKFRRIFHSFQHDIDRLSVEAEIFEQRRANKALGVDEAAAPEKENMKEEIKEEGKDA